LFGGRKARAEDATEWVKRGAEHLRADRYDRALSCFGRALKIKPDDTLALLGKAAALAGLKRHSEAVECLKRARDLVKS
jgi:tetratricopeptide (TPR) repeat protein